VHKFLKWGEVKTEDKKERKTSGTCYSVTASGAGSIPISETAVVSGE